MRTTELASAMEDDAVVEKKRTRITLACSRCRQRKIKCDGADVCQHCQVAGVTCEHVPVSQEENEAARARKQRARSKKELEEQNNRPKLERALTTDAPTRARPSVLERAQSLSPGRDMHSLPATSGLPMPYLHSPVESFVSPTWPAQPGGLPRHMLPALPAIIIPRGYHLSPDLPQQQLPLPAETVHPTQSHLDALIRHGLACEQDSHRISAHLVRSHAQLPYPIPTNQAAQSVIPQYTRAQPSSSSASHHRAPLTSSIPATVATTPADTSQSIPVSPTSYCTCQFGSRGAGVAVSPAPASTSSSHRSESEYAATSFQEYLPASSHAQLTSLEHIYRPDFAPHHQ